MQLSESKTLENLKTAFTNEAAAMVRYEIYADNAKADGDEEISQVFRTTANNERAHAELWFGLIFTGIPKTAEALEKAAHGENYEWTQMYKEYAETARQEGLDNIADLFERVGAIEKDHESRFNTFAKMLSDGSIRSSSGETVWLCRIYPLRHYPSGILSCLPQTEGLFSAKGRQQVIVAYEKDSIFRCKAI